MNAEYTVDVWDQQSITHDCFSCDACENLINFANMQTGCLKKDGICVPVPCTVSSLFPPPFSLIRMILRQLLNKLY